MDFIVIDGIERDVVLYKDKVDQYVKRFNRYYASQMRMNRKEETKVLIGIHEEKDQEKKLEMLNKYVDEVEKKTASIPFPYSLFYDIVWNILPKYEKKMFRNKFGYISKKAMFKSIRKEELQPILDFIGGKVLNLAQYNKKKV